MANYHLNKKWKKVDDATDCPNVFATMTGSSGNYVSDLSGAEIYALLQENPKQLIILRDDVGRPCLLTTPPTSGSSSLVFSTLVDTTLYKYTIANGGNAISVSTTPITGSSSDQIFTFNITGGNPDYSMNTTWADIREAKLAGKLIVANPTSDYVYYSCGDPDDEGITLVCYYYTSQGAKMRAFIIDTDGEITYSGVSTLSAENAVRYTAMTLSDSQKKQARDNIEATRKVTLQFYQQSGAIVCATSLAVMTAYLNNGYVLEGYYLNRYYEVTDRDVDHLTFVSPCLPNDKSFKVINVTNDGTNDVITTDVIPLGNSFTDEAKSSLLSLLQDVAYATPNGAEKLADLEDKLFTGRYLTSITALYQQDRVIYDTDSLDSVIPDLTVTAHYSDGTSETLADDAYTLSGTLTVGTSVIAVSYEGKTDSVSVVVSAAASYSYSSGKIEKINGGMASTTVDGQTWESIDKSGVLTNTRRVFALANGAIPLKITTDQSTYVNSDYFPIPIPPTATGVSVTVTPNTGYVALTFGKYVNDGLSRQSAGSWTLKTATGSFEAGQYDYITVVCKAASGGAVNYTSSTEPTELTVTFS